MMRTRLRLGLSLFILLIAVATPGVIFAADDTPSVQLMVGRSAVVDIGTPIQRVSLTSSDVADAMVTSSTQLLVNGKMPGTISMFVWERSGALRQYEIVVQRDLARLNDQLQKLFAAERIHAQSNGKAIVLSGTVSSKDLAEKAKTVAAGYVEKADDVVNLLQVQEGTASNQVLLSVRFAEVNRNALTDLGASLFTGASGYKNYLARTTTQQYPAPVFDNSDPTKEKLVFSDFLNLFLFSSEHQLGVTIKALQTKGLFQSLAEPNLVAESGKEASFLAGGEFPVPIAQGTGGNVAISIQYKEFGVRLNFTPVITGSSVHLKVRPEVSTLDFANGVLLQGFRIPALSTRRTETELELQDGQTFAIAGLLNNSINSTLQKIPGIGDIPILGLLFKSKAAQKDQTELVVMITPHILPRNSQGVTPDLPRIPEPFLPPLPPKKSFEMPPPAFTPARKGADASPAGSPVVTSPAAAPADGSPAAAAAAVSALTPSAKAPVRVQAAPAQPTTQGVQPQSKDQPLAATPTVATPTAATPAPDNLRPLTKQERRELDRAHEREEQARKDAAKAQAKQDETDRRAAKAEQEQAAQIARETAKLEKEKAKRDAQAAKVAARQAKRQAEIDREHQKALDEAAAKAREAEARYQALSKGQK
jgi:pilus assembly protein CpaC